MAKKQEGPKPKGKMGALAAIIASAGGDKTMGSVKGASDMVTKLRGKAGKVLDSSGRARQGFSPELLTAMPEDKIVSKPQTQKSTEVKKTTTSTTKRPTASEKTEEKKPIERTFTVEKISGTEIPSEFKSPVSKILEVSKKREIEKVPVAIVQMGSHAGNFPFYPSYVRKVAKDNPNFASKIDLTSEDSIKESIDKMSQDDKMKLYKEFEKFGIYGDADSRKYQPTEEDKFRVKK